MNYTTIGLNIVIAAVFGPSVILVLSGIYNAIYRRLVGRKPLSCVDGPPSTSFMTGHLKQMFSPTTGTQFGHDITERYGGVIRLKGIMGDDQIYVTDPAAIRHIVLNGQDLFDQAGDFTSINKVIFGGGIFSTDGEEHKMQRKLLNPAFTAGHLRQLVPIFYDIADQLKGELQHMVEGGTKTINLLEPLEALALELIGVGGLGHSFGSFSGKNKSNYSETVKELIPAQARLGVFRPFVPVLFSMGTPAFRKFIVDILPMKDVQLMKKIIHVIDSTSRGIYKQKIEILNAGDTAPKLTDSGTGRDLITLLMREHSKNSVEPLSEQEVIAEMGALIFAAHDTTSAAMSRLTLMLAENPEWQDRLRTEIRESITGSDTGRLEYDDLMSLPILDAIVRETLRVFPPVIFMTRCSTTDTVLPLMKPVKGKNGQILQSIPLPAKTNIVMSIIDSNRNADVWGPDAQQWKPERWLSPLPGSVADAKIPGVYSNTMTFMGGMRSCLGFKFAQLEIKTGLSTIINHFELRPANVKFHWYTGFTPSPHVVGEEYRGAVLPIQVRSLKG